MGSTREQIEESLAKANQTRSRRYELKVALKVGTEKIEAVLLDPPDYVQTMAIEKLLILIPFWNIIKANQLLKDMWINPTRRVGELTERQRREIVMRLK